jgi:hypothetical protein
MSAERQVARRRAQGLSGLGDAHPAWVAVLETLAEARDGAVVQVARPDLGSSEREWQAGYLSAVVDVEKRLREYHAGVEALEKEWRAA